ncbi:MAG TPA: BON domain-containing protein [Burkholderiales bacterium]|jgi:osmotically-inducible protein OsmY|nr:BON domain-containing protein [Burkholderiales bacterium]
MQADAVRKQVHAALERESRVNLHRHPVRIESADGTVTLEGEVADVAAKQLALQLARAVQGVRSVVDRLRVAPGERRGDGAVRDSAARLLLQQPELRGCSLNVRTNEKIEVLHRVADDPAGEIELSVTDGVVVLEGHVISQSHRRFAGAVAWWTPGRRDVINALEVRPAYEDRDDEVAEVMRLVLEADPELDADQIRTNCNGKIVFLEGTVPNDQQKRRAEQDAWSLAAIRGVVNRLEIAVT